MSVSSTSASMSSRTSSVPSAIFQLEIEGLQSSFPPLRTAQGSAFEGREGELALRCGCDRAATRSARRRLALGVSSRGRWPWRLSSLLLPRAGRLLQHGRRRELGRRPRPVRLDRRDRPGRSSTGRDHLGRRRAVGREPRRPERDPRRRPSRQAVRTIPIGDAPTALAATRTAVWVTDGTGGVSKIDPRYDRLTVDAAARLPPVRSSAERAADARGVRFDLDRRSRRRRLANRRRLRARKSAPSASETVRRRSQPARAPSG